ncbi:MAG: ankyrin repeat domain-containing protein [Clostridiales bacterium]|nr:ankyrin repeat domain-containing protein [Clostridiales bacterium]
MKEFVNVLRRSDFFEMSSIESNLKLLDLHIRNGSIKLNTLSSEGSTILHRAVSAQKEDVVEYLVNLKKDNVYMVDVNKEDKNKMTPLLLAVFGGHTKIVDILLKREDILLMTDDVMRDPLYAACLQNDAEIIKKLLYTNKINLRDRVKKGRLLLHFAHERNNIGAMEELIKYGIDVNEKDSLGYTVAYYTALNQKGKIRNRILELLMQGDKNCINVSSPVGNTLLHYACSEQDLELVKFLVNIKNLKINMTNDKGLAPIHYACGNPKMEIIKLLLERKDLDLNKRTAKGVTPLHALAAKGTKEMVRLFLDKGVDVNAVDVDEKTPLHYTYLYNNVEVMRELLNAEKLEIDKDNILNKCIMFHMCGSSNVDLIDLILKKSGFSVRIKKETGESLLWEACNEGNEEVVKFLLGRPGMGKDDKNSKNSKGFAPLHRACFKRYINIVKLLLSDDEVDINIADEDGWTPLHYMVQAGYTEIIEVLLNDPRVNINAKDNERRTPLSYACDRKDITIVEILLKKGADILEQDNFNIAPIHMVFTMKDDKIKELLKNAALEEIKKICKNNDISRLGNLIKKCMPIYANLAKESIKIACDEDNELILKYLVDIGVNINQRYENKATLTYYACLRDNVNIVSMLLHHNVDIIDDNLIKFVNNHKERKTSELVIKHATSKFLKACESCDESVALGLLDYDMDLVMLKEKGLNILEIANGSLEIAMALKRKLSHRLPIALGRKSTDEALILMEMGVDFDMSDENNKTVLMYAVENGYFNFAKELIRSGVNIDTCDVDGRTILMYASKNNNLELVNMLLDRGLEIEDKDKIGKNALMYAVESGSYKIIWHFVDKGADTMAEDKNGKSILMYALEHKMYGAAKYLLEKGVSSYYDVEGSTLLMYAAKGSSRELVERIMFMGFDVNYANAKGENALLWASRGGNRDAVEFLLENGAKVDSLDRKERKQLKNLTKLDRKITIMIAVQEYDINKIERYKQYINVALIYAIKYRYDVVARYVVSDRNVNMRYERDTLLTYTIKIGNVQMASYLIKEKADVNAKSENKLTALMAASWFGYTELVAKIIEAGAEIEAVDNNGMSAIWYAFLGSCNRQTIDYLLERGAKLCRTNKYGRNMLMHACEARLEGVVRELISRGISVNFTVNKKETPLECALANKHYDIAEMLILNDANIDVVKNSFQTIMGMSYILRAHFEINRIRFKNNDRTFLEYIISKKSRVLKDLINESMNDKDENGKTTLMYLCEYGSDVARLFIDNDIGINDRDTSGVTPLAYAMKGGNKNLVRALIWAGADLSAVDGKGKTILMYAIELKQDNVLMYRGLSAKGEDDEGNTALIYAINSGNKEIVEELLLREADINFLNKNDKTALMVAIEAGRYNIAKVLINYRLTDVNIYNEKGETALSYAAKAKSINIIRELLLKGAVMPKDGDTILFMKELVQKDSELRELMKKNILKQRRLNEYAGTPNIPRSGRISLNILRADKVNSSEKKFVN